MAAPPNVNLHTSQPGVARPRLNATIVLHVRWSLKFGCLPAAAPFPSPPLPCPTPSPQDKFAQKEHFAKAGVPLTAYRNIKCRGCMEGTGKNFGFPFMLKAKR